LKSQSGRCSPDVSRWEPDPYAWKRARSRIMCCISRLPIMITSSISSMVGLRDRVTCEIPGLQLPVAIVQQCITHHATGCSRRKTASRFDSAGDNSLRSTRYRFVRRRSSRIERDFGIEPNTILGMEESTIGSQQLNRF